MSTIINPAPPSILERARQGIDDCDRKICSLLVKFNQPTPISFNVMDDTLKEQAHKIMLNAGAPPYLFDRVADVLDLSDLSEARARFARPRRACC